MRRNNKKTFWATVAIIALLGGGFLWREMHATVPAQETHAHEEGEEETAGHHEENPEEGGHGHEDEHAEGTIELTPEQIQNANITVQKVELGMVAGKITVPGQIVTAEDRRALVVPKVAGVVTETFKNIGDEVKKGEVLAIIESREMAEAMAEYLAASSARDLAQNVLGREKALWEKKITAEQDYLNASNAAKEADIKFNLAAQKLRALGHSLEKVKSFAGQNPEHLRFHELISPIAGRVIQKNIILGAHVDSEQTVYDIADTSVVWVDAAIPASDGGLLSEGQEVSINEGNKQTSGKIVFASPVIDPSTRSIKAIAEIANDQMLWRPGSFVSLNISTAASSEGIVIPQAAIQSVGSRTVVFVQNEHGFEMRDVEKGQENGDQVEILSGLESGDIIATSNSFALKAELGKSEAGHEH